MINIITSNFLLKGYSEILWSKAHFSPYILILLHNSGRTPHTNLTSIALQDQSSFDKIGKSLYFFNFWCPASGIRVFNGEDNISHQRKLIVPQHRNILRHDEYNFLLVVCNVSCQSWLKLWTREKYVSCSYKTRNMSAKLVLRYIALNVAYHKKWWFFWN